MRNIVISLIASLLIVAPLAAIDPSPAYYNADKWQAVNYQNWTPITGFDTIQDGVTTFSNGTFQAAPGDLLHISGRCVLADYVSTLQIFLNVYYAGNVIPKQYNIVTTADRLGTFAFTFPSGNFTLTIYYDGQNTSNVARCNVLVEVVP